MLLRDYLERCLGGAFIVLVALLWYGGGTLVAIIGLFKYPMLFPLWIFLLVWLWWGDH